MTEEQPLTEDVPVIGKRYFGLGRNASYAAAKRGEIPTIKVGGRLKVPVRAMEALLNAATAKAKASA